MDITYKLLKLSSGEELITKILKKKDGTVYMESPMTFRSTIMSDPYTGGQKEITILKDWIGYASENTIEIPESFTKQGIIIRIDPNCMHSLLVC